MRYVNDSLAAALHNHGQHRARHGRIRGALRVKKISYAGVSYGTYLGAVHTTLFPRRSGRFLLDSALSPGGWNISFERRLGLGFQDRFPDFARYAATHPAYGLGTTPGQVTAAYFTLAARLDATPVKGLTGAVFRQLTFASLYYDHKLPTLAALWHLLLTRQGSSTPAVPPGSAGADNARASFLAVVCNDSTWPTSIRTYQHDVAVDRVRYPMFGAAAADISPCAFWPTQHRQRKVHIGSRGPSNVLIVQNRRDPVTSLTGARMMRRALGRRARMVVADQGGHLANLFLRNRCLNNAATRFLTSGTRPRQTLPLPT
jgi:pimeloyl-ACP methyl ester carboxylesterase